MSTSTFGGYEFANFRLYNSMAWTYCPARKISSVSFSRCISWRQTGMAIVIMTAIMAMVTSSAAIA